MATRRPRIAQSIITRSELELFGWSTPRFACRYYAAPDSPFFLNARRLAVLLDQGPAFISRRRTGRRNPDLGDNPTYLTTPAELLRDQSPIADCYLGRPAAVSSYHLIQVALAAAYGEASSAGENLSWLGTPYMQHIKLVGGGLCAQAVCFMATTLMHDHAAGVYGLAEITHFATNYDAALDSPKTNELSLSGLHLADIVRYFSAIGLQATWQCVLREPDRPGVRSASESEALKRRRSLHHEQALRAYLLSNMPVILLVDCGLMNREIYPENPRPEVMRPVELEAGREYRHAIVLVGTSDDALPDRDAISARKFCFNDPLWLPFMTATASQLNNSAAKARGSSSLRTEFHFLAITPKEVRLPFANAVSLEQLEQLQPDGYRHESFALNPHRYRQGLLDDLLRRQESPPRRRPSDQYPVEHVRLIQAKDFARTVEELPEPGPWANSEFDRRQILLRSLPTLRPLLEGLDRREKNWLWVQFLYNQIRIWNAELESPARAFHVTLVFGPDAWKPEPGFGPSPIETIDSGNASPSKPADIIPTLPLTPSFVTSFAARGLEEGLTSWPALDCPTHECAHAELYAFMQKDADTFLKPHLPATDYLPAVRQMSLLAKADRTILRTIADALSSIVRSDGRSISFSSMATFVSELSASPLRRREVKEARLALTFLVRLARELQQLDHPMAAIEIVAGSLVDGVWPAYENDGSNTFGASLRDARHAMRALLKRLRSVANIIHETRSFDGGPDRPISLAVELEPGPLYLLGNLKRVTEFSALVSQDPLLAPIVGLNLDVPHWFLSQIDPSTVAPEVLFRICHVHLSDHAKGHFSDGVLLSHNGESTFKPWMNLLQRRIHEKPPAGFVAPPFSGFISIEHEACKSSEMLATSLDRLWRLLGRPVERTSPPGKG